MQCGLRKLYGHDDGDKWAREIYRVVCGGAEEFTFLTFFIDDDSTV